jgi:hypothetical protein
MELEKESNTTSQHLPKKEDISCSHAIYFEVIAYSKFQKFVSLLLQLSSWFSSVFFNKFFSFSSCFLLTILLVIDFVVANQCLYVDILTFFIVLSG